MLGNCDKMVVISQTTNEWPQNQSNEKAMMLASTCRPMEKVGQEHQQQQQQQQPLKCPRCDSTNTKFCYYNNYSLSQPRHFCKDCKRYWTRGGTLRNVPVGGGCRKNKRVKRPSASSAVDGSSSSSSAVAHSHSANLSQSAQAHMDNLSSASNHVNPLLFGLPSNPSEIMNPSFPRFNTTRIPHSTISGNYDLQSQLNALGLGFSSGIMSGNSCQTYIPNGCQDLITSKSLPIFGNSSSCATNSSPAMASLLASTLQQQKYINNDLKEALAGNNYQVFEGQIICNNEAKEVKVEGNNRMEWNVPYQNEQIGMSEPSVYWNAATSTVGSWHDPAANIGSSVPSLI